MSQLDYINAIVEWITECDPTIFDIKPIELGHLVDPKRLNMIFNNVIRRRQSDYTDTKLDQMIKELSTHIGPNEITKQDHLSKINVKLLLDKTRLIGEEDNDKSCILCIKNVQDIECVDSIYHLYYLIVLVAVHGYNSGLVVTKINYISPKHKALLSNLHSSLKNNLDSNEEGYISKGKAEICRHNNHPNEEASGSTAAEVVRLQTMLNDMHIKTKELEAKNREIYSVAEKYRETLKSFQWDTKIMQMIMKVGLDRNRDRVTEEMNKYFC